MISIILITLITLVIDQTSKYLILINMKEFESIPIINNFFKVTFMKNTGAAFSFLEGNVPLIIIVTSIIIIFILRYIKTTNPKRQEKIFYSLIIGGAFGNLIDRIVHGYVIDFLDFNLFGYNYPVFNVADISIVVGIFSLIILSIIESRSEYETNRTRIIKNR